MEDGRYIRQTMLPEIGQEGQRRMRGATVLVVGLGGLGSVVATYLTGAGIGHLILADHDVVSLSNLQRQVLYTESEIGQPKAECAVRRLSAQSSATVFEAVCCGLTADNAGQLVSRADVVVDCTDNFGTRYLIDGVCADCGRPWVYGSIGAFGGQVSVFNHLSGRRYADLFPDREKLCTFDASAAGVIGPVPAVVGAVEALEVMKLIAGFGEVFDGRLFMIDLLTLKTNIIDI